MIKCLSHCDSNSEHCVSVLMRVHWKNHRRKNTLTKDSISPVERLR